jgi:2-methylisoborneol synthase
VPELYGPGPVRIDEALGREVDDRLVAWFQELGIFTDHLDHLRDQRYGRLAMLVHPDTDDPDRLMLAARWAVALFAVDDVYCDDESTGAEPMLTVSRLTLAVAATKPPHLFEPYAAPLAEGLRADGVLVALRSSLEWVAQNATPSQLDRIRHETSNLYLGMGAEAAWRNAGHVPPVWQYLASRQLNSFLPCIALIDVVGGYELPPEVYSDPRVHRATALVSNAGTIGNDLYSMGKERAPAVGDFNLPTLIAAEEGCSIDEAIDRSVAYHTDVMRAFEAQHRDLIVVPSPALQRYLLGLRAWIGGCDEWHKSSGRYRTTSGH